MEIHHEVWGLKSGHQDLVTNTFIIHRDIYLLLLAFQTDISVLQDGLTMYSKLALSS